MKVNNSSQLERPLIVSMRRLFGVIIDKNSDFKYLSLNIFMS